MKPLAILILAVLCGAVRADEPIVASTLREDGTTNTWTQADLQDALGMMNRMYWRDMKTDSGRRRWHGDRIGQYVLTNEAGRICRVDLYADMTAWTNDATAASSRLLDPEAAAKAAMEEAAKREAARRAWEAANLPPDLAALRASQRESQTTNTVTVIMQAN